MIKEIYLDLDDVLNRFTMSALRFVGCPVDPMTFDKYPVECGFDIICATRTLIGGDYTTDLQTFWDGIPRKFWATVPKSEECDWLLNYCAEWVGPENVQIATSPTKDPDCLSGKLEWIHQHLPEWMHRQYSITPRKWKYGFPTTLLIDDSDANVRKFREHGGHAILMPRPWNTAHSRTDNIIPRLEEMFRYFKRTA